MRQGEGRLVVSRGWSIPEVWCTAEGALILFRPGDNNGALLAAKTGREHQRLSGLGGRQTATPFFGAQWLASQRQDTPVSYWRLNSAWISSSTASPTAGTRLVMPNSERLIVPAASKPSV
jgi:hypothetical protein